MAAKAKSTRPAKQAPRVVISGTDREKFAVQVVEQYNAGMSIRSIAAAHGRSYGNVHALLVEAGATLRSRGGSNRA